MASDLEFADYVCEQLSGVGRVRHRKMFGEYAIYAGEKIVALVCDNQLFVKPTAAGRSILKTPAEAPPYPGVRPFFLIDEQLDDRELMAELIIATEAELPAPKLKKKKAAQPRKPVAAAKKPRTTPKGKAPRPKKKSPSKPARRGRGR